LVTPFSRREDAHIGRGDRQQPPVAEEGGHVLGEPECDHAERAPPVRLVIVDEIRGGVLEGDAADARGDRHPSDDVALARFEEALGVLLLLAVRADALRTAPHLIFDPPGALFPNVDRVAGGLAGLPRGGRVEPTIAGRAEPHLPPIDGPHYTPSVCVGWRSRSSRITRSTAPFRSITVWASAVTDRRRSLVKPATTCR